MSMDAISLSIGSALVGFGPLLCLFFQIAYQKSQLFIIVTTSAFFFLLSALCAGMMWSLLDPMIGLGGPGAALIPGIFFQFCFRCSFVVIYHKVERVIEQSIERGEARMERLQRQQEEVDRRRPNRYRQNQPSNPDDEDRTDIAVAKLKLELNDASCGLAAGIGFGGMHSILLYGTLLASESTDFGDLYQPSCPYMPSLIVSALHCFFFFLLDIFYMLFTFFGMRRRLIFPRGGGSLADITVSRRAFGSYFGNTRNGGNVALVWVFVTHLVASFVTVANSFDNGCVVSLSVLPIVTVITAYAFWSGVSHIYMPAPHSTERLSLPASFSYGSRAEAMLNGDAAGSGRAPVSLNTDHEDWDQDHPDSSRDPDTYVDDDEPSPPSQAPPLDDRVGAGDDDGPTTQYQMKSDWDDDAGERKRDE